MRPTDHLEAVAAALTAVDGRDLAQAVAVLRRASTIWTCGNGGSAATAEHLACDLAKWSRVRAWGLMGATPLLTAWSNDEAYAAALARAVQTVARPGDALVCLSTSGRSPNLVAAAVAAREAGVDVLAIVGRTDGPLARVAQHVVFTPGPSAPVIEDVQSAVCHALAVGLREERCA